MLSSVDKKDVSKDAAWDMARSSDIQGLETVRLWDIYRYFRGCGRVFYELPQDSQRYILHQLDLCRSSLSFS